MTKAPATQVNVLNEFTIAMRKRINSKLTSVQKLRFWKKEINLKELKLYFEATVSNNDNYKKKINIFFVCDEPILAEYAVNIIYNKLKEISPKVREPHKLFINASLQEVEQKGMHSYVLIGLVINHLEKLYQGIFNKMWGEICCTLKGKDTVFKNIFISADPPEVCAHLAEGLCSVEDDRDKSNFSQHKGNRSVDTLFSHSGKYADENNNLIETKAVGNPEAVLPLVPVYR